MTTYLRTPEHEEIEAMTHSKTSSTRVTRWVISTGSTSAGKIALTTSLYTVDTTVLSESAFTNRGRTSLDDGGAGNTESLDSFAIALDDIQGQLLKAIRSAIS